MRKKMVILGCLGLVFFCMLVAGYLNRRIVKEASGYAFSRLHRVEYSSFPTFSDTELSQTQRKLLAIASQEYAKRPLNYDDAVLKYTEGNKEAWCADFTSWIMRQAGVPYSNPNSGGWRIPGVLTLQAYYQDNGRYREAGAYKPKTGDVVFYLGKHGPFGLMYRQHVAIVLSSDGSSMTTIGGNEDGHMLIKTQTTQYADHNLVGFGVLSTD